jgi:predicted CopG family antitoxin
MPHQSSHSVTIRIKEDMYISLLRKAEENDVTLSEYIRAILRKELKEQHDIEERYGYSPSKRVLQ